MNIIISLDSHFFFHLKKYLGNPWESVVHLPQIKEFCRQKQYKTMVMKHFNKEKNLESILYEILETLQESGNLSHQKYYRNKDLKSLFGLSPNTISKYREESILPYTLLGEIYLYPIAEVNKKLMVNANY